MSSPPPAIAYRAEIDGLRAVAVLAVMLYHADPAWLPGGYAGVDVFLVISGYLITSIIAADRAAGRFTVRHFWERRARRILPALLTMLGCVLLAGLAALGPTDLRGLANSAGAAILFSGNLYFWRSSGGYFALAADQLPLLHLWSLGVEEQFYLLYPAALLLAWRMRPRAVFALVLATALTGFALSVWMTARMPVAGFFLLPARAWELLAGCALALWPRRLAIATVLPAILCRAMPAGGLAAILASFVLLRPDTPFPGLAALPVVLGTVSLIAGAPRAPWLTACLSARPLVAIGLISYGAYLWHHPLLALARVAQPDRLTGGAALALLALSLGIAWASWRWIERPMRDARTVALPVFARLMATGVAMLLGIVALVAATAGLPRRSPPAVTALATLNERSAQAMAPCLFAPGIDRPIADGCVRGVEGPVRTAIIGDSHAATLAPGFDPLLSASGTRARLVVAAGCPPSLSEAAMSALQGHCAAFARRTLAALLADRDIRLVILAARWPYYDRRRFYDNGEGGVERGPDDGLDPDPSRTRALAAGMAEMIRPILASGRTVLLVGAVPEPGWDVPRHMVHGWMTGGEVGAPTIDAGRWRARSAGAEAMLTGLGDHPRLLRIDPARPICGSGPAARCRLTDRGRPLYFDDDHPSIPGARLMVGPPDPRLVALLAHPD